MTVRIGITGGIGSGKSVVSRLLEAMGIPVYISDVETKRLMLADSDIRRELVALLGDEVYVGGVLNKPLLASYLFGNPEHALQVNGIIPSASKRRFQTMAPASCGLSDSRHRIGYSDRGRFCGRSGCNCYGLCSRRSAGTTRYEAGCFLARIDRKTHPQPNE
mgnify:CR=1 FL=1